MSVANEVARGMIAANCADRLSWLAVTPCLAAAVPTDTTLAMQHRQISRRQRVFMNVDTFDDSHIVVPQMCHGATGRRCIVDLGETR